MEATELFSISKLADYQTDSIVSRTIIDKKSGSVIFFAFDKGQSLNEHTSPYDTLVNVTDGKTEINISGESFYLKKGDMIIMPANKPHAVKAAERFKMLLTMIRD